MKSKPILIGKWLLDTGAGLMCISSQQFRLIPIQRRPTKLQLNQREAKGASGNTLIPDDDYVFPMEWDRKLEMQPGNNAQKSVITIIFGN
jgi:hypothetical protein